MAMAEPSRTLNNSLRRSLIRRHIPTQVITDKEGPMPRHDWSGFLPDANRPFLKMHGLQNHFVIVDARARPYRPSRREIIRICDVKTGVGADQLLIIEPPGDGGRAAGAHAFMRILNIDGQEAETCGNATRCVCWLLLEETGRDEIILETLGGILTARRRGAMLVEVDMGAISGAWDAIGLASAVDTAHLPVSNGPLRDGIAQSIGNPHVTFFVDDLGALDVAGLAAPIQYDPLFPAGVNVGVAQVMGPDRLRLSVYERPGILTTACGSGACVASRAARLRGLITSDRVVVEMPAGSVEITLSPDGHALMTGPVEYCFQGVLAG